jgi:hypothetical protein
MAPGDRGIDAAALATLHLWTTTNPEFLKSFPDLKGRTKIDRTARHLAAGSRPEAAVARVFAGRQISKFRVKPLIEKYSDFPNTQISL